MELVTNFQRDLHLFINTKEKRVNQLTDDEILKIREYIDQNFKVEGDLRRDYSLSIKRLIDLACYRGSA